MGLRIRTLKPEFFSDEKLAEMRVIDRFVFVALIAQADDAGRLIDNVKAIDGFTFPLTDDTAAGSLDVLARAGRILRYQAASGQRYIQIVHWGRHQRVDKKGKYVLPPPEGWDLYPPNDRPLGGVQRTDDQPSRDTRESLARESTSDRGSPTLECEQIPPTDDRPLDHARKRRGRGDGPAVALLPGVRSLLDQFYPSANSSDFTQRQIEVLDQLSDSLTERGTKFKNQYVRARNAEHLSDVCSQVADSRLRKPDSAIVVVLTRLGREAPMSRHNQDASEPRPETIDVDELRSAREWLDRMPGEAARVEARLASLAPRQPTGPLIATVIDSMRDQLTIDAYRRRGSSTVPTVVAIAS